MHYLWDKEKARSNLRKHGVHFADAVIALEDDKAITIEDPVFGNEQRFVSIGAADIGRVLITVFTYREDQIRIISSRRATRSERRTYREQQ